MTRRILYVLNVPSDAQLRDRGQSRTQMSKEGVVSGGPASVEGISLQPNERTLEGTYRGKFAQEMAEEFEELFNNDAIDSVAFYGLDGDQTRVRTETDGYYSLQNVNMKEPDPRNSAGTHYQWDGVVVKKGTRKTHWRAVRTNETAFATDENPFESGATVHIALPASASGARWYDESDGSETTATVQTTRQTEFIEMALYDVSEPSFDSPTLLYDLPYADEGKGDAKVWDDWGRPKRYLTETRSPTTVSTETSVGTAVVGGVDTVLTNSWPRVFDTAHEFSGDIVMENGLLRLVFSETTHSLSASRWNHTKGQYESVGLGLHDWKVFDVDLTRSGDDRVMAYVIWQNITNGDFYHMEVDLKRGYRNAVWTVPKNEDRANFPVGLNTKLTPIASGIGTDPVGNKTLVTRKSVRK